MEYDEGIQGGALRSAEYSLVNQHFGSGTQLVKVSDFEKLMAMGYVALKDWVAGEEITKDNLIALKWETPNMPTWSKTMDEIVADLNTILRKYEINTIERMRHFLTQCMKESNRGRWLREHDQLIDRNGWNDAQIQNNFEKNYSYSYPFNYRGVGYIHLTFRYGYQAFATYLLKERYPELNVRWGSPINTDAAAIETNYNNAVNAAQNKGHNIKLYTDIVDIGTTHVATYFAWETAGYFWMSTRLNDTVDTLKANDPDEVDKVTAVVNKYDIASSYEDRRNFYREVKNIIK
jgi:predicted chitinase